MTVTSDNTPAADAPFRYLMRVRYSECDAQRVVFNARYADYVDLAVTEFFRVIGLDYSAMLAQGLDNQVVSLALQWRSSARFDDVLAVDVETLKLGNTSFTLRFTISHYESGRAIAEADAVYVLLDVAGWHKTPLPAFLREALQTNGRGRQIDHAGVL